MCEAATLGTLITISEVGGATFSLAGKGLKAYGDYRQGKEDKKMYQKYAEAEKARAEQELLSAEYESRDLARRQHQVMGQAKAAAASNGVMLENRAESSPAIWQEDQAREYAMDREKLFYNANMQAQTRYTQASQYYRQARNARRLGNLKAAMGLIEMTGEAFKAAAGIMEGYNGRNNGGK